MKTTPPHIDYIRRVWVITVLLSCLLIASTASASEVSSDNDTLEMASQHEYIDYEGATTCLPCHGSGSEHGDASGFVTSIHNTWGCKRVLRYHKIE
jgi:cytochrome c553